jgi:hypothetical protein
VSQRIPGGLTSFTTTKGTATGKRQRGGRDGDESQPDDSKRQKRKDSPLNRLRVTSILSEKGYYIEQEEEVEGWTPIDAAR